MKIEGIGLTDITNSVNRLQIQEDKTFEDTLKKAYSDGDKEKLKGVCKEYEGLLLQMMYKQMKRTIPESELLPPSSGREIFQDMLDDELKAAISELLPKDIPHLYISAVAQQGLQELKDLLWKEINS